MKIPGHLTLAAALGCCLALAPPCAGLAGPDGGLGMALMSALVDADGTLLRRSGVTGVSHVAGTGQYDVSFDRDVSGCNSVATLVSGLAVIHTPGGAPSANAVRVLVQTVVISGITIQVQPQDDGFNLLVFCPR